MLQDVNTGMSPLMLGPVLIHQRLISQEAEEYGFAASVTSEVIADTFGKCVCNTFYAGLTDSASLSEFDDQWLRVY